MDCIDRFWAKVDKKGENDCWDWTASLNNVGYGQFYLNGKMVSSHRVSYIINHPLTIDLWEHREICVCHKCDNPCCVNPAHLFLGSVGDNMNDKLAKGRGNQPKGENHGRSKLTEDNVREIRIKYAEGGVSQRELALKYAVSETIIGYITLRKRWTHI